MSTWSTIWTVTRKELLDLSRDRRTLAVTLLLGPLLYPILMLGMGKMTESRMKTELSKTLEVPMVHAELAPNLVRHLATLGIVAKLAPADVEGAVIREDEDVAIVVSQDYAKGWSAGEPVLVEILFDSTRRAADVPVSRIQAGLQSYSQQVGGLRLLARGISPAVVRPLNVGRRDLASAEAKRSVLLSALLPYLLILTSFIGGAYLVFDTTAGERERQSLEPLLATPARRGVIVSGKILAACLLGISVIILTLLAFKVSSTFSTDIARQLDVSFPAMGRMLLVLLPMVLIGASLLTFLAAAAKSMKEAQSHMAWLLMLPMLPTLALAVNPIKSAPWQFAVPFLAQNQLLLKVIRSEYVDAKTWAIYLGASLALAAILWFAAVRRYGQERLAISG